jgi:hypothetical protein
MSVAPLPCPRNDGGTVERVSDVAAGIASILTGEFLIDGAKAITSVAHGATGTWDQVKCNVCKVRFTHCWECQHVWEMDPPPSAGDAVTCPNCHAGLVG